MAAHGAARAWWCLALASPTILAAALAFSLATHLPMNFSIDNAYPNLVLGAVLAPLAALILTRLPRHPIGLLFMGCGLASALTVAFYTYGLYGLVVHPGSLVGARAAGWVSSWIWSLGFAPLATLGVLLFPDGRLPSPRWRPLIWADVAAMLLLASSTAFAPGPLANHPVATNPLGIPLPATVFTVAGGIGLGLFLVGAVGGGVSAVLRWRRASGVDRARLRWFALAALLLVLGLAQPSGLPRAAEVGAALTIVAVPLLPLSVAVAILRHRLYGIEPVLRRSLVYAMLTALLLAAYAGAVVVLGAVFRGRFDPAVSLVATGLVALLVSPVRERLQRSADQMLFGDRGDPYAALSGLGRRLVDRTGPDHVLTDAAETVARALRLPYVAVEVAGDGAQVERAEWGRCTAPTHSVPLVFRGTAVGRLLVVPRSPTDPLRPADLRLLGDLAGQVGVAVHAVRLSNDLQRSREQLVTTREEERRRIRRNLHDGLGPALAGVAFGLDAARNLLADDPRGADELIARLKVETQTCVGDVRRLVYDLRPPALDQLGLVASLREHATQLGERDHGLEVSIEAGALPVLPAAVEVAAYRIATEALTNVARHARARHCSVRLVLDGDRALLVQVDDDGTGLPDPPVAGVGITSMGERAGELGGRCTVTRSAAGGTSVSARLPVSLP